MFYSDNFRIYRNSVPFVGNIFTIMENKWSTVEIGQLQRKTTDTWWNDRSTLCRGLLYNERNIEYSITIIVPAFTALWAAETIFHCLSCWRVKSHFYSEYFEFLSDFVFSFLHFWAPVCPSMKGPTARGPLDLLYPFHEPLGAPEVPVYQSCGIFIRIRAFLLLSRSCRSKEITSPHKSISQFRIQSPQTEEYGIRNIRWIVARFLCAWWHCKSWQELRLL